MKKILIRVITYNQEDVIRRALNSVLCQKDWGVYKVVVSDDCSKDHTWDILKEYKAQYPEIMDIHRNEHNLGIYENVEKADGYAKQFDYDLFGGLSGDDAYCDGYFEEIQKLIKMEDIDTDEAIGIYSDWKAISPDGRESVFCQECVLSSYNLWSLKARGLVCSRSLLTSKMVRNGFEPLLHGKGLNLTESHYDSQPHLIINKSYYLSKITSIYYTGVGVSNNLANCRLAYNTSENIEKWNYAIERYIKDDVDLQYAKYQILKSEYYLQPSWGKLFLMFYYYQKGQLKGFRDPLSVTLRYLLHFVKYKLTINCKDSK